MPGGCANAAPVSTSNADAAQILDALDMVPLPQSNRCAHDRPPSGAAAAREKRNLPAAALRDSPGRRGIDSRGDDGVADGGSRLMRVQSLAVLLVAVPLAAQAQSQAPLPPDIHPVTLSRLPPVTPEDLDDEARRLFNERENF